MAQRSEIIVTETLDVDALPRRAAHAVAALLEVRNDISIGPYGPYTAAEICLYDSESFSAQQTAAALRQAQKLGLAMRIPPRYWTATPLALEHRRQLEERFLRDTDDNPDL